MRVRIAAGCLALLMGAVAGWSQPAHYPVNPRIQAIVNEVSADSIFANIARLANFRTRHTYGDTLSDSSGIGAAMRWVGQRAGETQADSVWRYPWTGNWNGQPTTRHDLIADVRGRAADPARYFVGAHLDSRGASLNDATTPAPGADDNGSSCAAMLEMLRLMPDTLANDLEMMWFTGEEQGLYGSAAYADYLASHNARVDGMICMDMISHTRSTSGNEDTVSCRLYAEALNNQGGSAWVGSNFQRYVRWVGEGYADGFSMQINPLPDRPGRGSDHLSFSAVGYPSLRIIETNEDLAYQHGPNDSPANLSANYARKITMVTFGALLTMLEAPARPPMPDLAVPADGNEIFVGIPDSVVLPQGGHFFLSFRGYYDSDYDTIVDIGSAREYIYQSGTTGNLYAFGLARSNAEGLPSPFSAEATMEFPSSADDRLIPHPSSLVLSIAPNPFNPTTAISFSLPRTGEVSVLLFDISGRLVKNLSKEHYEAGEHSLVFDGSGIPSGEYFVRVESAGMTRVAKLVLLK